jgi:hypothetical protein
MTQICACPGGASPDCSYSSSADRNNAEQYGRPVVVDGGDSLQIWRVAVNTSNNQPRTADKGVIQFSVGREANKTLP